MKKILFVVTVFLISLTSSKISGQSFDKADQVLGFGFGIGGHFGVYKGYTSQTPAFGIMYEQGMRWDAGPGIIGLGAYLGYKSLRYKETIIVPPTYNYDYKWTYTIIGIRGAYHYEFVDNLDTYAGVLMSYNIASFSDKSSVDGGVYHYSGSSGSGLGLSLYAGGRYYFSDQWAAFLELGYGIAYLQLGAAYKF